MGRPARLDDGAEIGAAAAAGLIFGLLMTGIFWVLGAALDVVGLREHGSRNTFFRDHPWQVAFTIRGFAAAYLVAPILLRLAREIGWRGMMPLWLNSAARRTWQGPFYAGPLVHPVSIGDALLKLLQTIWRGIIILAVAAIVLALGLYISLQMQPPPLGEQIIGSARLDRKACSADHPLLVTFANRSNRTVKDIAFNLVATAPGRSRNLVADPVILHSDVILSPGSMAELCWGLPELNARARDGGVGYGVDVGWASEDAAP